MYSKAVGVLISSSHVAFMFSGGTKKNGGEIGKKAKEKGKPPLYWDAGGHGNCYPPPHSPQISQGDDDTWVHQFKLLNTHSPFLPPSPAR